MIMSHTNVCPCVPFQTIVLLGRHAESCVHRVANDCVNLYYTIIQYLISVMMLMASARYNLIISSLWIKKVLFSVVLTWF